MEEVRVPITRIRSGKDDIALPAYMTPGAAGMDLAADLEDHVVLAPQERALIPTGIAIALPPGFEAQIRPRSGLALRAGITLINTPGTIDSDYRGEIQIIAINLGTQPVVIHRGERLAQMVVQRICKVRWEEVSVLPDSERQDRGFGHTDKVDGK